MFVKEPLNFCARTCAQRAEKGKFLQVINDEVKATCYLNIDTLSNIGVVVMTDNEYPAKSAFLIINEIKENFFKAYNPMQLSQITIDTNLEFKHLDIMISKYQNPAEVDKLLKLETTLKETKEIVVKTMEDLIQRGEDLDKLMEKSKDISTSSYTFYKNARKANSRCCSLY
eukprot:TRINITY_DN12845_c0_g1_i1.p3 TRINITY_DN12845_c0_g1~~TRINITY_DN12845_c0_g1_i1.p3  ORF type:complete len:194 (+),score=44.97 TRINITY_DN12845_c0_g1_i1:71-583(+)